MFTIKINDSSLRAGLKVKDKSLSMDIDENARKVLNFELIDTIYGSTFLVDEIIGKKIELFEDDSKIFSGQLDEPTTRKINQTNKLQKIICVDWNFLADKRYINKVFSRQKISDIIKKIIDEYFIDEGITYNNTTIEDTDNYLAINCSYSLATSVFDEMADLIAFNWWIDDNKKFWFVSRTSLIGPSIIENVSSYSPYDLIFMEDRNEYRNIQILKDVKALTSQLTEKATPTPDDDNTYSVRFPIDSRPEIYITDDVSVIPVNEYDGISDSYKVPDNLIGIGGLDFGLTWYYWNKGNQLISKDPTNAPEPAAGYFIVVRYVGQYKTDIVSENYDEIDTRKAIEGGTGYYENVESGADIEGIRVAEEKAEALIRRFANIAKKIKLSSYTIDANVNDLCNMTFPSFNVNNEDYLIISKRLRDVGNGLFKREYVFVSGEAVGGWVTFFKKWLQNTRDFTLRDTEQVLQQLRKKERISLDGSVSLIVYNLLFPSDTLFPANDLVPGTYEDEVIYNEG